MTKEEQLDWLCRLRSEIYVYMPKEWLIPMNDALDMAIQALSQEPTDAVSRILNRMWNCRGKHTTSIDKVAMEQIIRDELSVTQKSGKWIYDETLENWRCSKCNETPKTMGYVGTADFMAEHFKFCNHCGAKMESEDKE